MAPHIARYRETISAITPYCALWCLNMANWALYPLPLFSAFPLGEHAKWRCDSPPHKRQKGYLSDTCAMPYETRQNACDTPLCDTISKGYCMIWGGISHWAAKSPKKPWERRENAQHSSFPCNREEQGIPKDEAKSKEDQGRENSPNTGIAANKKN